jgi:TolB protein
MRKLVLGAAAAIVCVAIAAWLMQYGEDEDATAQVTSCANAAPVRRGGPNPKFRLLVWTDCRWDAERVFSVRSDGSGQRRERLANAYDLVSADGRFAVTSEFLNDIDPEDADIVIKAIPSGRLLQLTHNPLRDWEPRWSPDGRRIVFQSFAACTGQNGVVTASCGGGSIRVISRDGGSARAIATTCAGTAHPDWSPDGRWIVYSNCSSQGDLFLVHPDGTERHNVTRTRRVVENYPLWSPDGRHVAFGCGDGVFVDLCVMNADGRGRRRLTTGNEAIDPSIVWSPDGRWIAYLRDRDGTADAWIVRVSDGAHRAIAVTTGEDDPIVWLASP